MGKRKFDSIYNNDGSNTIAKELLGILVFSFLISLGLVVSFFLFV